MFSIGGIASGLDTENMVRQLIQLERMPVVKLQQQQASLRKVDDAWGDITKRLSSLRTAIDDLTKGSAFTDRWKTASSNEAVATASVTGTPNPGSTTFNVGQLATAQSTHSGTGLAGSDALVGAGDFTIKMADGTTTTVAATDTTTLAGLAMEIDGIAGVQASVVKRSDGDHRLVLTAEKTGTANAFEVTASPASLGAFNPTAAQDAELTIGGLTVTRSSNTVTDLVEGVTLALTATGSTTVTTSQDVDSAVTSVKKLVDEVNSTLAKLKELTSYNAESRTAGPLQGDPTARRMVDQIRRGVMDVVGGLTGTNTTASSVGITMNRDGGFTLDEAKLATVLTQDPAAVDRLFSRSGSSALTGVAYSSSTSATAAGDYEVVVSQVAKVARLTGASYTAPVTDPETFTITADDGTIVEVTVGVGDNAAVAAEKINAALAAADVSAISASVTTLADGTEALELSESRYGSAYEFTVGANTLGLTAGTYAGHDVAGTIDGQPAAGSGRRLSLPTTSTSGAAGLVLNVGDDAPLNTAGMVTVSAGVAGRLDRILSNYEGTTGMVQSARDSLNGRIDLYQDRIDAFELRIASRETTIRRQFTAMETALHQLQSQGNWLAGQLGGLSQPPQ